MPGLRDSQNTQQNVADNVTFAREPFVGLADVPLGSTVNMLVSNETGDVLTCSYIAGQAESCQVGTLSVGPWKLTATAVSATGEPLSGIEEVQFTVNDENTVIEPEDTPSEQMPAEQGDNSTSIALLASLLALIAIRSRQQSGLQHLSAKERDSSGVASFAAGSGSGGLDLRSDVYCPPCFTPFDLWVKKFAFRSSYASPALGRSLDDGSYLRALTGIFWPLILIAGGVLGAIAALSTDGVVALPALWIVMALLTVGIFDALAGVIAAIAYALFIFAQGGFNTTDSVRGFLGLAALMILIGLIASAVRPYRRASVDEYVWNRIVDFVLIPLLGAWAAGSIFQAIPHLSGYRTPWANRVGAIEITAIVVLIVRFGLENAARHMVSNRLRLIENEWLPEPTETQKTVSRLVRTAVFAFVAVVFIGANWWLATGTLMYLIPQLLLPATKRMPNSQLLYRLVPRNLVRIVAMLLILNWWGSQVLGSFESNQVQWAFVLMSIPGLVLNMVDWFARKGRNWHSTPISKVLGFVVLLIGVLIVRGVLFA
jgi:hypothetical protein